MAKLPHSESASHPLGSCPIPESNPGQEKELPSKPTTIVFTKKSVKKNPRPPSARPTQVSESAPLRTSQVLRDILDKNRGKSITVQNIVDGLGTSSFGTSLMVFSLPEILFPLHLPGVSAVVVIPTGVISYQMIRGKNQLQFPSYFLKRTLPRPAFAAAVQAILPLLERAEKAVKPRGKWVQHPLTKRFLGLYIMALSAVIALPIPWTCMIAATAIFIIALGMVEKDGLLISLGILLGLVSMALVGSVIFLGFALLA